MMKVVKNLAFCVILSLIISVSYISMNNFNFTKKECAECRNTNNYLASIEQTKLVTIKNEIQAVQNSKPQKMPELNGKRSAKEIFKANKVLVMGDSFVEGLDAYRVLYSENTIWKRGKRINQISDQIKKAVEFNPKKLILAYGTNDILMWNANIDGFINAYKKSIEDIKVKLPDTEIYVSSILPPDDKVLRKYPSYKYVNEYNNRLRNLCEEENIQIIDSSYILKLSEHPYGYDGIHPNRFYFFKWAIDIIKKTDMEQK